MHKPMKPPLKYHGGKAKVAAKIGALLPQHIVYVEPFCGGASVMFKKPWPTKASGSRTSYMEVINDTNKAVVAFWRMLRDPVTASTLERLTMMTPYSPVELAWAKESLFVRENVSDMELARSLFIASNMSFSGRIGAGFARDRMYSRGRTKITAANALHSYAERMACVIVDQLDAIDVIKKWDSPQTCFYCDPPYPGTEQGHYAGYTQEDFELLVTALDNCKGSFVLSCYDNEAVPESWERAEFEWKGRAENECVWRRFNTEPVHPKIQTLYDHPDFDCFVPRPKDLPYG